MTRESLLSQLVMLAARSGEDPERAHSEADDLLLEYIGDEEITEIWNQVEKWYS